MNTRAEASDSRSTGSRALTWALFAIYAVLLIGLVLVKFPFRYDSAASGRVLNLIPFAGSFTASGAFGYREVLANVAIFVPYGLYIAALAPDWSIGKKLVPIIATTVGFEAIQYIFAIGRADITDVMGNVLGGLIGIALYAALARVWGSRAALIVNIAGVVSTTAFLTLGAVVAAHSVHGR